MGLSTTNAQGESATATFALGPDCAIFTEDGRRVEPGSGESGRLAVGGPIPLGYYKDPVKSAQTIPTYEGKRWSMPGDWASVDADGTVRILGRGSQCINTGGEKVFPEEVEEALKRHPSVRDAAVTGVPDARFGERIVALVEPHPGQSPDEASLRDHVKAQLATYKAPRHVLVVDSVARAPQRQARLQGDQGPRDGGIRRTGSVTIRNKAFIAGAFEHPTRLAPDKSTPQLHAECAAGALAGRWAQHQGRRRLFLRGRRAGVRRDVDDRLHGAEGPPHRQ